MCVVIWSVESVGQLNPWNTQTYRKFNHFQIIQNSTFLSRRRRRQQLLRRERSWWGREWPSMYQKYQGSNFQIAEWRVVQQRTSLQQQNLLKTVNFYQKRTKQLTDTHESSEFALWDFESGIEDSGDERLKNPKFTAHSNVEQHEEEEDRPEWSSRKLENSFGECNESKASALYILEDISTQK